MPSDGAYSRLPIFYLAFAHASLATASILVLTSPQSYVGFFYHPRMVAVVHLVTLGWISASILGALYMIAPMALRAQLPAGRADWWAFWAYAIGVSGMVSHFWIDEMSGMAWAAGMVVGTLIFIGVRVTRALSRAPVPAGVRVHFQLAFCNIVVAGTLGALIGINKLVPVLPGFVLNNVYAHAHLAALGWGLMTVMGAGYRLLPMLLPAAPPTGPKLAIGAVLLEVGVLGLFVTLMMDGGWLALFAILVLAGIGRFLATVAWMGRNRRPPAKGIPRPDFGVILVVQALAYLIVAAALGLVLVLAPPAAWLLRLAPAYATVALLGFLGQIVVGVTLRIFPLFAWIRASRSGTVPRSPHTFTPRWRTALVAAAWSAAVPAIAIAGVAEMPLLLRAGAWLLLIGVLGSATLLVANTRAARSSAGTPSIPVPSSSQPISLQR